MAKDAVLLVTLREQIREVPQRAPGYRDQLMASLAEIVRIEDENLTTRTNVVQRVTDQCKALGLTIHQKDVR